MSAEDAPEVMSDLNRKLRWLIALRLLIVVSISASYFLFRLGSAPPTNPDVNSFWFLGLKTVQLLVAMSSLQTLVFIGCLQFLRERPEIHAYLQFGGDLITITTLLYSLGEGVQSFSILYFVVISVASVLLRRSSGLVVATVAFLLFAAVLYSPSGRWFQTRDPGIRTYTLTIHLIGFYAAAFLTSYLVRDITRVEERLREKNLDLASLEVVHRDVIQSISSGLVTTDPNGIMTSVNRSAETMLGRPASDLVRRHIVDTGLFEQIQWDRLTNDSVTGIQHCEARQEKNQKSAFLRLTVTFLRDGEGAPRGYIVVLDDLTDERRLQEELRIKDRMAAIGEMAAGLAHEIGNPLAAISGSVQVLSRSTEGDSAQAKLLGITLRESQRLDRTVKSFLKLAGSRQRRIENVDIAALLAEDTALLRNSDDVQESHTIEVRLEPESATIRADPDQIGQIFWNIARNALQAMPDGGKLLITGILDATVYRIDFTDTGSGMTEEERSKLFHPFKSFFDQGTGIGMAIVYRIVEEHGGNIVAESEVGEGTTIRVELPVAGPPTDESLETLEDES